MKKLPRKRVTDCIICRDFPSVKSDDPTAIICALPVERVKEPGALGPTDQLAKTWKNSFGLCANHKMQRDIMLRFILKTTDQEAVQIMAAHVN